MPHSNTPAVRTPLRHTIDVMRSLLLIDLLEVDDVAAVVAAVARIQDDPAFSPDLNVRVECGAMGLVPTADTLRDLACA